MSKHVLMLKTAILIAIRWAKVTKISISNTVDRFGELK